MSSLVAPGLLSRVNKTLSNIRTSRKRRLGLLLAALCVLAATAPAFFYVTTRSANITYFSKASGLAPELVASWSTTRDGLGTPPPNFTSGDTFVIQNGHNMANVGTWSISGANSKLQIENGGTLTANAVVTLNSATTFQIDNGGTYVQNVAMAMGSNILQGTEVFGASSNFIIQVTPTGTSTPSSPGYGNLTFNITTGAANFGWGATITAIQGNFTIQSTGSASTVEQRMTASGNLTMNIGGNLSISGGTLVLSSGAGVPTINLSGNYNQTGGTLTSTGSGIGSINFSGGSSFVTFSKTAGTLTATNINWSIALGKIVEFQSAFTIPASRTFNINTGGMLLAAATITNSGTMNVSGEFRLTDGGFANGNNFIYGAGGTLGFVASGSYVVGNDAYWPTTNGPVNVNVLGLGMTLNVARTVTGLFQYSAGVTNAGNLSLNGTSQVNAGGFMSGSPTYGASSTLKYNIGASYGRNGEWLPGATSGAGYPNFVHITNNTTLDLPNGSNGSTFQTAGGIQIDSGSALSMGAMTEPLIVLGSVQNEGTLALSTALGGDIKVGGNWTRGATGTFTPNGRAAFFIGSADQTVAVTGGGAETFNFLVVGKPSGSLLPSGSDIFVTASAGDVLQLLGAGGINLNGRTFTLSGNGGNLLASGGTRNITGTGNFDFAGAKSIVGAASGTLNFASAVTVNLTGGVNFGGVSALDGTLNIKTGGFVNTNPPTYGSSSLLRYDNGTTFNAAAEFPSTGVANVTLASTTQLNLNSDKTIGGTFTISARVIGSTAATPFSISAATLSLSSGIVNVKNLTTTSAANITGPGTINVAGNWNVAGFSAGTSSNVNFNGTGAQSIQTASSFPNLTASNDITLDASPTVSGTLALGTRKITTGANILNIGGSAIVTRTSGYIIGNESRSFPTAGSHLFTFDVGTANGYSPVDADISIGSPGGNTLTAKAVEGQHPNITGANALQRYWTLSGSFVGSGVADLTFRYLAGDVNVTPPTTEADYDVFKFNPVFTNMGGTIDTVNHTATVTGVSSFSDWTLATSPSVNGEIRFAQSNTNDSETNADHAVNIAVQRAGGGSAGEVSVNYNVTDGTATTADGDYAITPASGTLTWTDGDTADKNITITVKGDTTYEANEVVNLALSSPTGGASLGSPSAATLTITNDDAPPATLVVNTTNDADDGFCLPSHCSLREAINAANLSADTSAVNFNIPNTDAGFAGGVFTIQPTSELPTITRRLNLDGATQTTFTGDTNTNGPEVVINGGLLSGTQSGLLTSNSASGTIISNLVVNGFAGGTGIAVWSSNTQVLNNYLGTNAAGTAAVANAGGLAVGASAGVTSGYTISGNLISGNTGGGISSCDITGSAFSSNKIGTDRTGASNVGNGGRGISTFCSVWNNNTISANTIAFNTGDGWRDDPDYRSGLNIHQGNKVTQNSIHSNTGLGINLSPPPFGTVDGVTPNDAQDADNGGNRLQNFPVITKAEVNGSTRTIEGTLNSAPGQTFTIEVFSNSACDASGNGEGQTFIGSVTTGTTDANGDVAFSLTPTSLNAGQFITATATDSSNNTSEFSQCFTATAAAVPTTDVSVSGGNLVVTDVDGGDTNDTLTVSLAGASVRVNDPNNTVNAGAGAVQVDANTVDVSLASITGNIQVNTLGGNDTLTLALAGGDFIPAGGLSFAGGTQTSVPGDKLVVTGGTQGAVTYNYTSASAGSISMQNFGDVSYTGLEPITNTGTASDVTFNLPAGPSAATLADDGASGNTLSRLSGATFETTDFANPTGSVTINRGNASDTLIVNALPDFNAALTLGTSASPFATITFNGAVTLAADKSLSGNASGIISLSSACALGTSGTGAVTLSTARNIILVPSTSITVANGNLTLEANQQASPTSGNFRGIFLNGGTLTTTGTGKISLKGKGGADASTANHQGITLNPGALVQSTSTSANAGTITFVGTGATGTTNNRGVEVFGATVTSVVGDISFTGTGGTGGINNFGVSVFNGGVVSSTGAAKIIFDGTGGSGASSSIGSRVSGEDTKVTSAGGDISITGRGGTGTGVGHHGVSFAFGSLTSATNGAKIIANGTGGTGSNSSSGVIVSNFGASNLVATKVTSDSGDISFTGTGGAGGLGNVGWNIDTKATVVATGAANITINGTGGTGTTDNYGVGFESGGAAGTGVSAVNGNINITGTATDTTGTDQDGVRFEDSVGAQAALLTTTGTGNVTITGTGAGDDATSAGINFVDDTTISLAGATNTFIADTMDFGASAVSVGVGANALTLRQKTNGIAINLGGADSATQLGLTDAELDVLSAATLNFGNANSGAITVSAAITRALSTALNLTSGGAINLDASSLDSAGGNIALTPGASASVAPAATGADVSMSTTGALSFASGADLSIPINGTTVDTQYRQLNVVGLVDITGVDLALSGTHTPVAGQTFTIIANDLSDAITGTFNGLSEGALISNFLGSGLQARVSYTGDTGNDCVITVLGSPSFSIGDVTQTEGDAGTTTFTFTVTKTGATDSSSSVDFATSDGTAQDGAPASEDNDYQPTSNTLNFAANETSKQISVTVNGDTVPELDETFSVALSNATNATISDATGTGTIENDDESVSVGQLIISEFRLRGPGNVPANAASDEFIELYNNTDSPIFVTTTDSSAGWALATSDGVARFLVPNGTTIPARGHFLGVNTVGYSLATYPSGDDGTDATTATPDATYTTDIPDNTGIALFRSAVTFDGATRLDSAGPDSETNALYKEGAGYPALAPADIAANLQHSFYRSLCSFVGGVGCTTPGVPKDSENNASDFLFVDTDGTTTAAGQRLGAPGPENLTSPVQSNSKFSFLPLDRTKATTVAPNRARDFAPDPSNNSPSGTISIRRRVTNTTGSPVTRLRFRIIEVTTFPAPSGIADLRVRSSSDVVVTGIDDADTCSASGAGPPPCGLTVRGTILETPPAQTSGGGFGSSLGAGNITLAAPLQPGESINVNFLLGIKQTGTFRFLINIEALTGVAPATSPTAQSGPKQ